MYVPPELLQRAQRWPDLRRWERRELGQDLRKRGLTYKEIGRLIPVPKGTLSGWCRDLELDDRALSRLANFPDRSGRRRVGAELRRRTLERAEMIRDLARKEGHGLLHDSAWVAGVVAYWAEGSKAKELRFANSDPAMVRLFIEWAQTFLSVESDRFDARLHLHDGQDEDERKGFWSAITGIPLERFGKTFVKQEGTGHRKNLLYAGTISVRVSRSGDLLHRVSGWMDAMREVHGAPLDCPAGR